MEHSRYCLQCAQEIKGRVDKKFCDDQCRSNYNRAARVKEAAYVRSVNMALRKNRDIIIKLNIDGKTKVSSRDMIALGFDFGYFTSILRTTSNNYYYFCYEMGYIVLANETVLLVIKENHKRMQTHTIPIRS